MKIAKNIKTIVCDDVRSEMGGKISLMGIYARDMAFSQTPMILPILHFVIMLEDIIVPFKEIFITMHLPAENNPSIFTYPAPPDIEKGKDINLVIGFAPFKVTGPGECKIDIAVKKDGPTVISHSFAIKVGKPQPK